LWIPCPKSKKPTEITNTTRLYRREKLAKKMKRYQIRRTTVRRERRLELQSIGGGIGKFVTVAVSRKAVESVSNNTGDKLSVFNCTFISKELGRDSANSNSRGMSTQGPQ